jgi:hypothetical protein
MGEVPLFFCTVTGHTFSLTVPRGANVSDVKRLLQHTYELDAGNLTFVHQAAILPDQKAISSIQTSPSSFIVVHQTNQRVVRSPITLELPVDPPDFAQRVSMVVALGCSADDAQAALRAVRYDHEAAAILLREKRTPMQPEAPRRAAAEEVNALFNGLGAPDRTTVLDIVRASGFDVTTVVQVYVNLCDRDKRRTLEQLRQLKR